MFHRTARALTHLLYGLGTGIVALVTLVLAVTACTVLSVTHAGAHVFLASTTATRYLAGLERRRAALVLPVPIPRPYRSMGAVTAAGRARQIASQAATWRDVAWLMLLFPLALVGAVVALVLLGVDLAAFTAPAWVWALPPGHRHDTGFLPVATPVRRALTALTALILLPLLARLVQVLSNTQARMARMLLAPGRTQQLAERADHLTRTRTRVIDAQAAELQRIERDLHDGAQARIVGLGMTLALAEHRLSALGPAADSARADLTAARREVTLALEELRHLVRGIHPPILTDRGLDGALTALFADHPLPVTAHIDLPTRLPPAVESAAYFLIAEALANIAKHAHATRVTVTASTQRDGALSVTVTDNGCGGANPEGTGLTGLRRRLDALDATLTLTSPPGGPTRLHAEFPCAL